VRSLGDTWRLLPLYEKCEYFQMRWLNAYDGIRTVCQHNMDLAIPQEFYRWPLVTQAAKNALEIRWGYS